MSAPTASCGTAQTSTVSVSSSNTGYTYTWSVFPLVGSGITGNPQTSSLTVTPVSNGNYTFTVNAADAVTGCVTSGTTSVGYYVAPSGTATVTQPTSCGGSGT